MHYRSRFHREVFAAGTTAVRLRLAGRALLNVVRQALRAACTFRPPKTPKPFFRRFFVREHGGNLEQRKPFTVMLSGGAFHVTILPNPILDCKRVAGKTVYNSLFLRTTGLLPRTARLSKIAFVRPARHEQPRVRQTGRIPRCSESGSRPKTPLTIFQKLWGGDYIVDQAGRFVLWRGRSNARATISGVAPL